MNNLLNWLLASNIYMVVFYLFYVLLLSRDTSYRRNRYYLIGSLLLSLILPVLRIDVSATSIAGVLNGKIAGLVNLGEVEINPGSAGNPFSLARITFIIWLCGFSAMTLHLLYNIGVVSHMVRKGQIGTDNRIIIIDRSSYAAFSAFGYIFINSELGPEERACAIEHERRHLDYHHFTDLVLIKVLSLLYWFNPIIYLFGRSLKSVHEYQADNDMITSGRDASGYWNIIMNQVFSTGFFTLNNAFAGKSLIKKRMIMMTRKKSSKLAGLKLVFFTPVLAILFILFSCAKDKTPAEMLIERGQESDIAAPTKGLEMRGLNTAEEKEVFVVVEEMPTFNGGDNNYFRDWVQKNVEYPEIAIENGIQGKVYVMFVVNDEGKVNDVEIMRGVDPSLDNEVIRVVESSPVWVPGKQRGVAVNVRLSITVNFQLN